MTITLPGLIILIVIAALCGAVGRALAGGVRGGFIVSVVLGFIGTIVGPWIAHQLKLAEPLMVNISGQSFGIPVVDHRRCRLRSDHPPHLQTVGRRTSM